jgi:hypothetical protein
LNAQEREHEHEVYKFLNRSRGQRRRSLKKKYTEEVQRAEKHLSTVSFTVIGWVKEFNFEEIS